MMKLVSSFFNDMTKQQKLYIKETLNICLQLLWEKRTEDCLYKLITTLEYFIDSIDEKVTK